MARADGYFPPGSMLRRVHEERAVGLLYGQRALGIGALAPLNFVGTRRHTKALDRPFRRLVRRPRRSRRSSSAHARRPTRCWRTLRGYTSRCGGAAEDAGPFGAGTPYSAFDPELMLWTMAVMADSAEVFYELFVRRLGDDEREELRADYVRFAALFGMPSDAAPASYGEFRAWWNARLASDETFLTEEARYVASAVMFQIPVPATRWPAMRLHNLIMRGSLPPRVRELYGLRWTRAEAVAFRSAVAALRAPRPIAPRRLRTGWNTRNFDLVGATEKARAARGRPIPGALA